MKLRGILLALILLTLLFPVVKSQGPLVVVPLNNDFTGVPGDIIVVPFRLTNLGNQTISNVTVYITGPPEGFLYPSKVIREPIAPNESLQDTLTLKILNINPGVYNLTLVARSGSTYSEAQIRVHVKTLVDYALKIEAEEEYTYGSNVSAILRVTSQANGVIIGRIGYTLSKDGRALESFVTTTYLRPGESWTKMIQLTKPEIGNYEIYLWANFSGRFKSKSFTFRVYQRNLGYEAYFMDGAIHVYVYDENHQGVPGIEVRINGIPFKTDDDGMVSYLVDQPGTYKVVLNLDGKVVTTFVEVRKLFISATQENETLIVRVVDSTGTPVPNITVTASGPLGKEYSTTDVSGTAVIDLGKVGYGTIMLRAESNRYVEAEATFKAVAPITPTPSPTTTTPTNTTTTLTPPSKPPRNYGPLAAILLISGVLLAGTSYAAFFMPVVQEEMLDRYYFVKVKAPKLRPLENFRFEKAVTAIEVRATKGNAKIEDSAVVWEIDHLEPEEEAYLQVILG